MASACDQSNEVGRPADNVFHVPALDSGTACIRVQSGDQIILPIHLLDTEDDPDFRITEGDGALVIERGGATVILQGFVAALDDYAVKPVVVMEVDGTPIDIAVWLASSDPNLDITCQRF